jgi:sugar O-acyltransferase (sialic acid O-acetyltransferase NeuD family)
LSYGLLDVTAPQLVVYGAGGHAREVCWLAEACPEAGVVVAMVDDDPAQHGTIVNGIRVCGLDEARRRFPSARMTVAIGSPRDRADAAARAAAAGFTFASLIHPRSERSRWVEMGEGVVICAGSILTTNIRIGQHVHINLACTISHDVVLGDFVTVAPGAHISGRVHVGDRAYIGTGACIINGESGAPILIGEDAMVGAAACVTRDVAAGTTVVGVPARPRS